MAASFAVRALPLTDKHDKTTLLFCSIVTKLTAERIRPQNSLGTRTIAHPAVASQNRTGKQESQLSE
jgi:hypothetical protein